MALAITTLADNGATARAFTGLGGDRVSSDWLNTAVADPDCRLSFKHSISGQNPTTKQPIRRTLCQVKIQKATTTASEIATVNITIQAPVVLTVLTEANLLDARAYAVNALTAANFTSLRRGEV